jgi:hypothetical protein
MIDYSKGKIYMLVRKSLMNSTDKTIECYIGSTCIPLKARMAVHKSTFNTGHSKCSSVLLFEKSDEEDEIIIVLLEPYPCENGEQLRARERFYQKNYPNCINKNIAGRGQKQWYQEHKQQRLAYQVSWHAKNKEYHKKYYQDNKENYKQRYQDKKEHSKEQYRMKKEQELQSEKDEALKNKIEIDRIKDLDNKTHYHCECGSIVMAPNKSLHLKSKKHMKYKEDCDEDCDNEL